MEQQIGVFMTPEYLKGFAEAVSESVFNKVKEYIKHEEEGTISIGQASQHLQLCEEHVRRLARAGVIKGFKKTKKSPWRFYKSDLNDYVRSK